MMKMSSASEDTSILSFGDTCHATIIISTRRQNLVLSINSELGPSDCHRKCRHSSIAINKIYVLVLNKLRGRHKLGVILLSNRGRYVVESRSGVQGGLLS